MAALENTLLHKFNAKLQINSQTKERILYFFSLSDKKNLKNS